MEGRYFTTTKKGEIAEWKSELRNMDKDKRKDAVKKVIAAMTVGKDVASLFPDVINCMQTDDLELKKLVYLYLINYAKSQPDLAIMAVNTFVKDSQDNNPLIRALAVRTMGCIRVDRITEYLCDPLQKCLRDQDPYVRKTAAICVVKLHDISPQLVEDHGFLDQLRDLLSDPNPMVVANAVAALAEIQEHSNLRVLNVTKMMLSKLLAALGECTEWGQVFILDALAQYEARDRREAEMIIERVIPRLQHVNCAVVLSAVKVVIKNLEVLGESEGPLPIYRKLAPPLVSLLSSEPEVQYVALRNISLIIQKYPSILQHEIKAFFCKYNDPVYVKLEKIDILIKLVSMKNIDQVLLELKEYATEVDMVFVKRAIRAIGQCAVCVVDAVERCIKVLVELVQTKVNFLVQQAVIIIVDIFRQFPNRFEGVIPILCENLETLDDPEAKAALIWVLGEYADRISNAVELLESFLETFPEEEPQVQLQLLTSAVKLFLKNPTERPQQMIQLVLSNATGENDNPDLRDRAYIYWRLLSSDPEGTKEVLLGEKPAIDRSLGDIDAGKLKSLLANISTLSSVYHCLPEEFVTAEKRTGCGRVHNVEAVPSALAPNGTADYNQAMREESYGVAGHEGLSSGKQKSPIDELLGLDVGMIPASQSRDTPGLPQSEMLTGTSFEPLQPSQAIAHVDLSLSPVLLLAEKGKGLEIRGFTGLQDGTPVLQLHFRNATSSTLNGFRIQVNKNVFGLSPISQQIKLPVIEVNQSATTTVLLKLDSSSAVESQGSPFLQVAVKNETLGVVYFAVRLGLSCILASNQRITPAQFVEHWQSLPAEKEKTKALPKGQIKDIEAFLAECEGCSLHCLARRPVEGSGRVVLFLGGVVLPSSEPMLVELSYSKEKYGVQYCVKCAQTCIVQLGLEMFSHILEKHTLVQG